MNETLQANGPLSELPELNAANAKAYEYAVAMRLQMEQRLGDAQDEIVELRVRLAETEAALKAMREHNDFLEDKLNIAIVDRTRAIDEHALDRALLDVILAAIEKRKKDAVA